jgi:hypothetical protein
VIRRHSLFTDLSTLQDFSVTALSSDMSSFQNYKMLITQVHLITQKFIYVKIIVQSRNTSPNFISKLHNAIFQV